jgi:chorismate synthase
VAAGAVAAQLLRARTQIDVLSYVEEIGGVRMVGEPQTVTRERIEASPVRCPDAAGSEAMAALIEQRRAEGDSAGGLIRGWVRGVPAGLGEPVFDKLGAELGKAMLSINAAKGFEIGAGFAAARLRGSEHNDGMIAGDDGKVSFRSNHAGGILGGISSGADLWFRVAFKPTSTIARAQETVTAAGANTILEARGRHDPCVLPRAVPIVDAMAWLVLADHWLRQQAIQALRPAQE